MLPLPSSLPPHDGSGGILVSKDDAPDYICISSGSIKQKIETENKVRSGEAGLDLLQIMSAKECRLAGITRQAFSAVAPALWSIPPRRSEWPQPFLLFPKH